MASKRKVHSYDSVQKRRVSEECPVLDGSPGLDRPIGHEHESEDAKHLSVFVLTALLEKAINQVFKQDQQALLALQPLVGRVVRIKTREPYMVIYCQICETGVRLLTQYDGQVDVRIQMPAGKLVVGLMQTGTGVLDESDFEITVLGDRQVLEQINRIIEQFSLFELTRDLLGEWLPGSGHLAEDALLWMEASVPPWMKSWQKMPELASDLMVEVKHMAETQAQILTQLKAMQAQKKPSSLGWVQFMLFILLFFAVFAVQFQQ